MRKKIDNSRRHRIQYSKPIEFERGIFTVNDMSKHLRKAYELDFKKTSSEKLKKEAVIYEDYFLDMAGDVKELLDSGEEDRYFYIDAVLGEYKRELEHRGV